MLEKIELNKINLLYFFNFIILNFNFGKEIIDLLGLDLFNISDISNEEEYLSWADKHLIL